MEKYLKPFSATERELGLRAIESEEFDICIIGGGITGAGVARDAASRGMKVCLVEQSDFASGTSSRSSKLIHGGIRYLENMEFGLVFEALHERHILFEIAPHLVHPLTFVLPIYEGGRVGMFKMGLGMWLYDLLALLHVPKFHEKLSPAEAISRLPHLESEGLLGAYAYSDAYMDDDRLVIETMRSAYSHGATCVNYVKAGKGEFDDKGKLHTLNLRDELTNRELKVGARHFVSTVGPWTDQFAESLFKWKKVLRPTKGIHLTLNRERLGIHDAAVMSTRNDKRIIFAIPRKEMVIIGTTDTDFQADPSTVHTNAEDVAYLLKIISQYFPSANLTENDIIASYAGVRPLVNDGSGDESKTSREHVIVEDPHNVTFVAGGKYTTYRRMARDIVEAVLNSHFNLEERIQYARNQTRTAINPMATGEKLVEANAWAEDWAREFGVSKYVTKTLAERHGVEALKILNENKGKNFTSPWEFEADFALRNTMCIKLRDFLLRRSPLFLSERHHGEDLLNRIAHIFRDHYSWSEEKCREEIALYHEHESVELGWRKV